MPNQLQNDPEKLKLIQHQFKILLHAHKCQKRENSDPDGQDANKCTLPHCKTMKEVLNHMINCGRNKDCTVRLCWSSRQIISHWKSCKRSDCPVCLPVKQANKENNSDAQGNVNPTNALAMNLQSNNNTTSTHPNQSVNVLNTMPMNSQGVTHHLPVSNNMDTNSLTDATMNSSVPLGNDNAIDIPGTSSDVSAVSDQNSQAEASNTKEWHSSITPDLRTHIIYKLVQAMFRMPDSALDDKERVLSLVADTKKIECEIYESADSLTQYYDLIADKIYEIQKKLEKKNQENGVQQMQLTHSIGKTSVADVEAISPRVAQIAIGQSKFKAWHLQQPLQNRIDFVNKIMNEGFPAIESMVTNDVRGHILVAYAKTLESNTHAMADSIFEYKVFIEMEIRKIEFESSNSHCETCHLLNRALEKVPSINWRTSISPDFRNHLIHKLVQAIFPTPDPAALLDKRMHNLVAYAKKVEGDMYEIANSRSEYYHLLAEKIHLIQKELEEKRQKRKELQRQQSQTN